MKRTPTTMPKPSWLQRLGFISPAAVVDDDPASQGTAFGLELSLGHEAEPPQRAAAAPRWPLARFARRHR